MKNFKKIVSVVMLVVLFTTNITAYASVTSSEELSNTDMRQFAEVTSSEFPDAFILSQYYDRDELGIHINNETISINSDKKRIGLGEKETVIIKDLSLAQALEDNETEIIGVINTTVFFEEEYEIVSEQGQEMVRINNSRLLTQDEVEAIGIENIGEVNEIPVQPLATTYNSRGRLDITFVMTTLNASGYAKAYKLAAYSTWNGLPLFPGLGGSNDPGFGEDFMGFTWGGQYDYYDGSASATRETLGAQNVYLERQPFFRQIYSEQESTF